MNRAQLEIRRDEITSPVAFQLISALNAELSERYPEEGANHFRLDVEEVREGRGAFLIGYSHGTPVGCGAIRKLDEDTAEIKRMFVAPAARGLGVGRAMLAALETVAEQLGVTKIVLETGERQPEAVTLYESVGFARIPAFGEYVGSPLSLCMGKSL